MGGKEREGRRRVWTGEVVVGCVEWTGTGRRKKACPRGNGGEEEGLVQQRQRQHLQQHQQQQQHQSRAEQQRPPPEATTPPPVWSLLEPVQCLRVAAGEAVRPPSQQQPRVAL